MSYFMQNGDSFFPTPGKDAVLETLPTGNYIVQQSMSGLYYERAPRFDLPGKMYGDIEARAERIINTFEQRERATGVLLAGEKGSGKSQLARLISHKGYAKDIPTILVNAPWAGDGFNSLLANVEQPAIVLMDEFEKVYDRQQQEAVLTLLDGSMTTKKLFVLTVNDKWRIDDHMRNRPGRLYYALDFDGLETDFVREYCEDNLDDQEQVEVVVRVSALFSKFNFDMLKALVEEMNRYQEGPFEVLEWLNAKPVDQSIGTSYMVRVWTPENVEWLVDQDDDWSDTPLTIRGGAMAVYAYAPDDDEEAAEEPAMVGDKIDRMMTSLIRGGRGNNRDNDNVHLVVRSQHVRKIDADQGVYTFVTDDGHTVTFTKKKQATYNLQELAGYHPSF